METRRAGGGTESEVEHATFFRRPSAEQAQGRMLAVGDVGFCGAFSAPGSLMGEDLARRFADSHAIFANLETPLVPHHQRATPFVGSVAAADRLATWGISIVSIANNHVADAGPAGIASTLSALKAEGIGAVGAGPDLDSARRLLTTRLGDLSVGWLACARTLQAQPESGPVFWELDPRELLDAVRRHRHAVDVLVVSIHWGYMFVDYPAPDHRALTHDLAAAGADLVVCHHAHVVQGVETVPGWNGRTAGIYHNLGNFLFDWTVGEIDAGFDPEPQRRGVVVAADFDRDGLCRLSVLPTRVDDDWVVRWMEGDDGRAYLEHLERISADLAGDYEPEFRRQRAERNTVLALKTVARRLRRGDLRVVSDVVRGLRPRHASMLLRWLGRRLVK